jgi:hypothetical protein
MTTSDTLFLPPKWYDRQHISVPIVIFNLVLAMARSSHGGSPSRDRNHRHPDASRDDRPGNALDELWFQPNQPDMRQDRHGRGSER